MSNLYIANTGEDGSSRGVWRVSSTEYQYQYAAFIPGQDVNLDLVSIRTNSYIAGQSAPNNFQVGLYGPGINGNTPGSLISLLSGPSSPAAGAYSNYTTTAATPLNSGTQYWLGYTLSSDTGTNNNTRVKLSINNGNYSTLGSGWSVPAMYKNQNGTGYNESAEPLVFSLYGTPVCFCSGTFIRIADGTEKMINQIEIGDYICTSKGVLPVKWIARRIIRRSFVQLDAYLQALPVKISAGSIDVNIPAIDLYVSETHGICVDDRIVNASFLINDLNITKTSLGEFPSHVSYYHLEFEEEVFVVANGLKACSYVNIGNRRSFDNYAEFIRLYMNLNSSVRSRISNCARNQPSLIGHKSRIRRSWNASASAEPLKSVYF